MSYYDYLGATKQQDNKQVFEKYLMKVLDYTEQEAKQEARFYY